MMAGAPVLIVSVYMLYNAPRAPRWPPGDLAAGHVPRPVDHGALAFRLGRRPRQDLRAGSQIFGILTAVGVIGSLTALAIPILLEQRASRTSNPIQAIGWFVMVMIPITLLIAADPDPGDHQPRRRGALQVSDYARLFAGGT
jgi:hypothetical protein